MKTNKGAEHVYAIIRIDSYQNDGVPIEERITVTKVLRDVNHAEKEVDRLNGLQSSRYFMQVTRLVDSVGNDKLRE